MDFSRGLARVRQRLVPGRPTGLVRCLRGLAVRSREFCRAPSRNVVSQIRGMGMHRNLLTAFAVKVEHPNLVVLQQHLEVVWCHLHGVLCAGRRNSHATQSERAESRAELVHTPPLKEGKTDYPPVHSPSCIFIDT